MDTTLTMSRTYDAILSPQGQITVPVEIRKIMNLKPGTTLSLLVKTVRNNLATIIAYTKPTDSWDQYYGIGKDFYAKLGGAEKILSEERKSWD